MLNRTPQIDQRILSKDTSEAEKNEFDEFVSKVNIY